MTVLLHMPLGSDLDVHHDAGAQRSERVVLQAATGVVATSEWTRQQVLTRYAIPAHRVHVAQPGVDEVAAPARPRPPDLRRGPRPPQGAGHSHRSPRRAACPGLASRAGRPLDRDLSFVDDLRARITGFGYGDRIQLTGVLKGAALSHAYATADLLVAPSRSESYGMTVIEALAHGLPVIATAVGGLPEALGCTADGTRPGQLVPAGDPAALAAALGTWLGDDRYRRRLRAAAREWRSTLRGWEQTA